MKSYKEYKERQEAKKFFRQNNDHYLTINEGIELITKGSLVALILGIIHGTLINLVHVDLSILYIVIGLMIANTLTDVAGRSSKQIGILSVILTIFAYYVSNIVLHLPIFPLSIALVNGAIALVFTDVLSLLFYVLGILAAYLQGKDNKFM